jgi:2-polyprenyl-3-methyl-5-hydroxy-6-metoxy-1,4-benzoquinol methylase
MVTPMQIPLGERSFVNHEAAQLSGELVDFSFGENWKKYLDNIDDEAIRKAEADFRSTAGVDTLAGGTFLDLGCGSGLNSLVALRMHATRVLSIDADPHSVEAAQYLRKQYARNDPRWEIRQGSILDTAFMETLGSHSFVLSWGVLHHTGKMWTALDLTARRVADGGTLFISLYNWSRYAHRWLKVKRFYNTSPSAIRRLMVLGLGTYGLASGLRHGKSPRRIQSEIRRGMNYWRDIEDWLGGLPYEYCKPDQVVSHLATQGFRLRKLTTTYSAGCNEFVFEHVSI